jgi:hypothetical protein
MRPAARLAVASCAALAVAGASAPAAPAATTTYRVHSFDQSVATGLEVTGPLARFRAISRVRVVVPGDWRRESAPAGRLRFLTPGAGCRYRVTFSVSSVRAAAGDAATRVDALLPVPRVNRLLDEGRRQGSAFRVIRPLRTQDPRIELRGVRSAVLTRRADIAGAGQVAWSDVAASALSRPGDECHSGTYRVRMGPQLADALATARTTLRFREP